MAEKNISAVNLRFGKNISALRNKNKMSMQELADKLGVSKNSVWFYEKGERTPTLEKILQLSNLFAVSVDTLLKADAKENLREVTDIPAAFILNGTRYDFKVDREYLDKAQKSFTLTVTPTDGVVDV